MDQDFFRGNRSKLIASLKGGLIVLTAYTRMQRRSDMAAQFSQEPNFWYLTGISEPDWQVVIDGAQDKAWLVMPEIDEVHRVFEGGLRAREATKQSGISTVIAAKEAEDLLRQLRRKHAAVHTVGPPPEAGYFNFVINPAQKKNQQRLERIFDNVIDCRRDLAKLRSIKQPSEVKAIQYAINLTISGFNHIQQAIESYTYEYEIEAEFTRMFRGKGATGHAYDPIIAAGGNACTLHYTANSSKLKKGSLILMDVGAEVDGYTADITRTIQKGAVTNRQKEVHAVVVAAQKRIVQLLKPSFGVEQYQRAVDEIMADALRQIDLYENPESVRKYMPHAVSHGLGIDVHDSLASARYFEPGMVLTVEPGIYIPEEGIGVRIEDDILITDSGHRNLSQRLSTSL